MALSHLKLKEKCLRNNHKGKAIPSQFWLADLSRNHVRAEVSGTCAELNLRHLTELANVGSLLLKIFSSYRSCWNNWNRFEKEKALKTLIAWKEFKKEVFEVNNPSRKHLNGGLNFGECPCLISYLMAPFFADFCIIRLFFVFYLLPWIIPGWCW